MKFLTFNVEHKSDCGWDYVFVGNTKWNQTLCGSEEKDDIEIVEAGIIKVHFHSDNIVHHIGFQADFRIIATGKHIRVFFICDPGRCDVFTCSIFNARHDLELPKRVNKKRPSSPLSNYFFIVVCFSRTTLFTLGI